METVVGLIPDAEYVIRAKIEMQSAGFSENEICVLRTPDDVWSHLDGRKEARTLFWKVTIGALLGLATGILYGATTGYSNCTLVECSNKSDMVCLALIMLFCVFAGGLFGAFIGPGLDPAGASQFSYIEGVQRGQVLFSVETSEERADEAMRILKREHGQLVNHFHREVQEKA